MKNLLRKLFFTTLILPPVISVPAIVEAHQETISVNSEYIFDSFESENMIQSRALSDAIRLANLQAVDYIKNLSQVENKNSDVIETIAANILKIQNQPRFEISEDQKIIRCYLTATIDDDDIISAFDKDAQEIAEAVRKNREYLENQKRIAEEFSNLKAWYENAETDSERQQILEQIQENDREFVSNEHLFAGNKLFYDRKFAESIEEYNQAIEIDPNNTSAYINKGFSHMLLEQLDESIKAYSKAVELNPNSARAYADLGNAYAYSGNFDEALKNYDRSIALDANQIEVRKERGSLYYFFGRYDEALDEYKKILELDPNDEYARERIDHIQNLIEEVINQSTDETSE